MSVNIGARIRILRKKHGMTVYELANKIGVTNGYISQLERGISGYTPETLEKIAETFGVSPALLQFPGVDLDHLADFSEILKDISSLPPETQGSVLDAIRSIVAVVKPSKESR